MCRSIQGIIAAGLLALVAGCSPYSIAAVVAIAAGGGGGGGGGNGKPNPPPGPDLRVVAGPSHPALGSVTACPGDTDVALLQLELTALGTVAVDVSSIQFHATGAGDDSTDIVQACLWLDVNGNGSLDLPMDTAIGACGGYLVDNGTVSFSGLAESIAPGAPERWLLTYDLDPGMPLATAYQAAFQASTDITATVAASPAGVDVPAAVPGDVTATSAGSVAIATGVNNPPGGGAGQCTVDVSVLQVAITVGACEDTEIQSVTFTGSGTGDDAADLTNIRLFVDSNGDGALDGGDVQLGAPQTYGMNDGTVGFAGINRTIGAGGTESWILVYDLTGTAAPGATFAATIALDADVTARGAVSMFPFPVSGAPVAGNAISTSAPVLSSASYLDTNDNGAVDAGDTVTVVFSGPVTVNGNPGADTVFALTPAGTFGAGAVAQAGGIPSEVDVVLGAAPSLQPNGTFPAATSSGLDMVPAQTGVDSCGVGIPPLGVPVDLAGQVTPRITTVVYMDQNADCLVSAGDTIEVTFTTTIDLNDPTPSVGFQQFPGTDDFGTGAAYSGPTTGVATVTILLGNGPVLAVGGVFDPATPGLGPSGIDVTATPLIIVDSAFPGVSATPGAPPGLDVGSGGAAAGSLWTSVGDDAAASGFGATVARAGDINGDTFQDVIVGAPQDNGGTGKVFVFHGSASGLSLVPDWTMVGETVGDNFGWSVASAGDVNADLIDDVIIGAPQFGGGEGKAYVWYGSSPGGLALAAADWTSTATTNEGVPGAEFGWSVASAGDVDNDGDDEVIVGAHVFGTGGPTLRDRGKIYLWYGAPMPGGLSVTPTGDFTNEGDAQGRAELGTSVASAGDVDNDTFDDIIAGAPLFTTGNNNAGKVYVWHGSATGIVDAAPADWEAVGLDQQNASLGFAVASAGDVDNDGDDEVLVGAPDYDAVNANAGLVLLYLGDGVSGLSLVPDWQSSGDDRPDVRFGAALAPAGDLDGDLLDDVVIGAPQFDQPAAGTGKAYVFRGDGTVFLQATPAWTSTGEDQGAAEFGFSVAPAAGIVPGAADRVLIGAHLFDTPTPAVDAGKAYIFCLGL